ncbi:hypothetical protein GGS23DRAFT_563250 [Durotheca rogersii]|uniref:uncharacterized protein n=1 Tax=Durotheca rogersii TaxID=419775 RepID=UPI00221FABEB|nr:uncharacterized protein GGS23DRAFT_563250 [Durotheca rogersii]KAI5864179.1 hypothetical protein GGS23DRAFT_563250 [Durotheca rogersii]
MLAPGRAFVHTLSCCTIKAIATSLLLHTSHRPEIIRSTQSANYQPTYMYIHMKALAHHRHPWRPQRHTVLQHVHTHPDL